MWKLLRRLSLCSAVWAITVAAGCAAPIAPHAMADPLPERGMLETVAVHSDWGEVPVQVRWAPRGGDKAVYLLDGMRADPAGSGWVTNTSVLDQFADDDVTLVMPIGGGGSWYADWTHPVLDAGRPVLWKWETFLTEDLPAFLAERGVSETGSAVVGLSMSASTALTLTARHRDQFQFAAAFSGLLDWSGPAAAGAVTAATAAAGQDVTRLAAVGSETWGRLDPSASATGLAGADLFISSGTGLPAPGDFADPGAALSAAAGSGLEAITWVSTQMFAGRLRALGIDAVVHFPLTGSHNWAHWDRELAVARPHLLEALGIGDI